MTGFSCVGSVVVLILTTQAAPLMWRVGSTMNDPAALADLLDRFTFWTTLRIGCVDLSFLAMVSAMTILVIERRVPRDAARGATSGRVGTG
ncbi:MAG: hypothetical protein ABI895_26795 [Deltaproteobacteria bacterium]